jgi:hypothetical protein
MDVKILLEAGVWMRCVFRDEQVKDLRSCRVEIDEESLKTYNRDGDVLFDASSPRSWWAFDGAGTPIKGEANIDDFAKLFIAAPGNHE